jgi:hypothetical protein
MIDTNHVLTGCILRIIDRDRERFTVSVVQQVIGDQFAFAQYHKVEPDRRHRPLPQHHLVTLTLLAEPDRCEIFRSWPEYLAFEFSDDLEEGEAATARKH